MHIKSRLVIVFLLLSAISLLTACSTNSPGDKLGDAIIKSIDYETYQSETCLKFKITPQDPILEEEKNQLIKTLNKTTVIMKSSNDIKKQKSISDISFNIDGIIIPARLYADSTRMWIKVPLEDNYVYLGDDMNYLSTSPNNPECLEGIEMMKQFAHSYIQDFNIPLSIKSTGRQIVATPEGRIKTSELTVDMNDEEFKKLLIYAINHLFSSPDYPILLSKIMLDQNSIKNMNNLKENVKEIENSINGLNFFEDKCINITFGLDAMNYIRSVKTIIPLSIKDNPKTEKLNIELSIESIFYNINKTPGISLPEFRKENTIMVVDIYKDIYQDMLNNSFDEYEDEYEYEELSNN